MQQSPVVQTLTVNNAVQVTNQGHNYDASGNLTGSTSFGVGATTWSGAEQMASRTPGATTATYTYAGTNQVELITEQPTGGARLQTYGYGRTDSNGLPVIESHQDGASVNHYIYDPQGTPLAMLAFTGQMHYLVMDGLGSAVGMVNHDGTHTYDPYGQATASSPIGGGAHTVNLYRYAGGTRDASSVLIHYGMRWYDPTTGRFTQQDSLETLADPSRSNRYEYAASNPINYVDPTGLATETEVCFIACVSVGVSGSSVSLGLGFGSPGITAKSSSDNSANRTGVSAEYGCSAWRFDASYSTTGGTNLGISTEKFSLVPECSATTYFTVGW